MTEPKKYEFNKCPKCGSSERIAGRAAKRAEKRGLFEKDAVVAMGEFVTTMVDPRRIPSLLAGATVPQVRQALDSCAICGATYCIRADEHEVEPPPVGIPGSIFKAPPNLFGS